MIARYTVVLKTLLDDANVKPLIDKALSTYPMYVPANQKNYSIIPTREQLNTKLLNHYKYREIGFETVGRFLDELETTMNEIMPYYYQLFKSEDIMNGISDPFGNVDITETFEEEREGTSKGTSKGNVEDKTETTANTESNTNTTANSNTTTEMTNNTKNVNSKTPQSNLEIINKDIDSVDYADNVTWNKDDSNSTGETKDTSNAKTDTSSTSTSTGESSSSGESSNETNEKVSHTFKKVGNQGVNTYAHDMKELREIFLNIEQQIINDPRIKELFMLVY